MPRKIKNLSLLQWKVSQILEDGKTGLSVPAKVPGDLISDLMIGKCIKDPYYGMDSKQAQWVDDYIWDYETSFDTELPKSSREFLVFQGVDYNARFYLNNQMLGEHEGMFGRILFEVTEKLESTNNLKVSIKGIRDSWLEKLRPDKFELNEWARVRRLKTQMSFGWDFAPKLKNYGIWDEVYMLSTGPVIIHDLHIMPDIKNGNVKLEVTLDSRIAKIAKAVIKVNGPGIGQDGLEFNTKEFALKQGISKIPLDFKVDDHKLWSTWDMGEQNIYRLEFSIVVDKTESDCISQTFGFRKVEFERHEEAPESEPPWIMKLNGKRLFMRGLNWVPPDSMLAKATPEKYEALIKLAKDANVNMLRIWGGGLREKRIFYDLCDRYGILVWQEFPLACAFTARYPRSRRFMELVESECSGIMSSLRNHPCIAIFSGGNEIPIRRNRKVLSAIGDIVKEFAPDIMYIPASPCEGESHNWMVWHGFGNHLDYFADSARVISEFGLQAAPDVDSLQKFIPPNELWPMGKSWEHHRAQVKKLIKYARISRKDDSLEAFVAASQHAQAWYIKQAVEWLRRNKYKRSGALVWQLNEPWPAISWALVDYYLKPKLGYHAFKSSMSPLLASAVYEIKYRAPGDKLDMSICIVNDYHRSFNGVEIEQIFNSEVIGKYSADVKPDSVISFPAESITLPEKVSWDLKIVARHESKVVSDSDYDLAFYDAKRAPLLFRAFFLTAWKWIRKPMSIKKQESSGIDTL